MSDQQMDLWQCPECKRHFHVAANSRRKIVLTGRGADSITVCSDCGDAIQKTLDTAR